MMGAAGKSGHATWSSVFRLSFASYSFPSYTLVNFTGKETRRNPLTPTPVPQSRGEGLRNPVRVWISMSLWIS